MPSLDEQKRALRAELRNRLPKPGSPEFVAASVQAQDRLANAALRSGARMVALYRALPSECGTAAVAAALQAQGCEVCYPAVAPGERALQFRRASGAFRSARCCNAGPSCPNARGGGASESALERAANGAAPISEQ